MATTHSGVSSTNCSHGTAAWRRVLGPLAIALIMLAFVGIWCWQSERAHAALLELPQPQRQALYERSVATLQSVCVGDRASALSDLCRRQAELVMQLPECDGACQALAAQQSPRPTR